MFDKNNPYTLRVEEINNCIHYYVSFRDGQADFQETEINFELYSAFREFEKCDGRQKNFFRRHIEHSELTEATLNKRAICPSKSIEEHICDNEFSTAFWAEVGRLPQVQRRRFLLYYECEFTYEKIAEMEGCKRQPVTRSIERAREKILKALKD